MSGKVCAVFGCNNYEILQLSKIFLLLSSRQDNGHRFDNTDHVICEVDVWIKVQSADFYNNCIRKVKKCWGKCVNLDGDYVEKC